MQIGASRRHLRCVAWANVRYVVPIAALLAAGCSRSDSVSRTRHLLEAYCSANVVGVGAVDVEADYLPSVVNCENGNASFEALKAQAVAARTYLYYRLDRTGDIDDGTGDQVYTCGREPGIQHYMAAQVTAGEVLQYRDVQVAAFYVAGALQSAPGCRGGTDDPTGTERYVTYNDGKSGADVEQTSLGLVKPGNLANRGCMSQNGSDCLSDRGGVYDDILRFYYGSDIELVRARGACVPDFGGGDAGVMDAGGDGGAVGDADSGCDAGGGGAGLVAVLALIALRPCRRRPRRRWARACGRSGSRAPAA